MATIATLVVKVLGDASDLKSNMASATQDMKKQADAMKSFGASLTAGVTLPILGLGAAAIKGAADQEQLQVAFTTMLGSADKATNLIKQLQQFSAATPFEMPEVVTAGKQLLAFGIAAEDIQPTLTMLGDVASGIGAPVGDLAYLFGTASASGRLMTADINQFANRGIPIIHALGQAMGVTDDKVRGLAEQGKITSVEMKKAFQYMTAEGSQFGGMMAKQSATLAGMFSTLKDNIGQSLTAIGVQLVKVLNLSGEGGLMTKFLDFTTKMKDGIVSFTETHPMIFKLIVALLGLVAAAGPVIGTIGMLAGLFAEGGMLATGITAISAAFGILTGPIGLVIAAVALLATAIHQNWFGLGDLASAIWGRIASTLSTVAAIVRDTYDAISWIFEGKGWNVDWWGDITDGFVSLGLISQETGDKIASFLYDMGSRISTVISTLKMYFASVVQGGDYLNDWLYYVPKAIQPAVEFLGRLVSALRFIPDVIGELVSHFITFNFSVYDTTDAIQDFLTTLGFSAETVAAIDDKIWNLSRAIQLIPDVIGELVSHLITFDFTVYDTTDAIQDFLLLLGVSRDKVAIVSGAVWALSDNINALRQYFIAVVQDGDSMNDWLTHLPASIQPAVLWLGMLTAAVVNLATGNDFATLQTNVTTAFSSIGTAIHDYFTGDISLGGLATAVSDGFTSIKDSLATFFGGQDFQSFTSSIVLAWNGLVTAVQDGFASIDWSPVTAGLSSLQAGITSYIEGIDWAGGLESVQTGANNLRDGVLSSITGAINGIDWSGASLSLAGMINWVSDKINAVDWSQLSASDVGLAIGKAIMGMVVPGVNLAIAGIQWVMDSSQWAGLVTAVQNAFTSIQWGELGTNLLGLVTAIGSAIAGLDYSDITGKFDALKTTITGAIDPVVTGISDALGAITLPTPEDIATTLNTFRDNLVQGLTNIVTGLDLTASLSGLLTALTTAVTTINWSGIGSATATAISLALSPEGLKTLFAASVTAVAPALAAAIAGLVWVFSSDNWANLTSAIVTSITTIDWSTVGESFGKLKDAIVTTLGDFANGFTSAFQTPAWLTSLLAWEFPSPTELLDWSFPSPTDLISWKFPSPTQLISWAFPSPTQLLNWKFPSPSDLLNWKFPSPSDLLNWKFPSFPEFHWPSIPAPSWLSGLLGGNAIGTDFWRGGLTWVGEAGPELVYLPQSTAVKSAGESKNFQGDGGTVNIGPVYVNDQMDAYLMAYRLDDLRKRRDRR